MYRTTKLLFNLRFYIHKTPDAVRFLHQPRLPVFQTTRTISCSSQRFYLRSNLLNVKWGNLYTPKRTLKLTPPRQVIHPVIWLVIRPFMKGFIFIFGRYYRHRIYAWIRKNKNLVFFTSGVFILWSGVYYYQHLETTPITNRRRFVILDAKHLVELCELQARMLTTLYNDNMLPANDVRVDRVRRVMKRLVDACNFIPAVQNMHWNVHVVDSPDKNAFVLASGDVFFLSGMFETVANEDQLAIILAHELSHAILGHSLELMSWSQFSDRFLLAVAGFLAVVVPGTFVAAFLADVMVNKAVQVSVDLPYNRKLEREADDVGLRLAAVACYDTRESYAYWLGLHLQQKVTGAVEVPSILSTHPSHGERAERLDGLIEQSLDIRSQCPCPPLKRYDPRVLADAKKRLIERELALQEQWQ